jgi:two-component system nitrogen regulation sensor histidine kinase NtrY
VVLTSRRANAFLLLEIACLIGFAVMAGSAYLAFVSAPPGGQPLPSTQTAVLLLGTLIPAMALLVLLGRRLALRHAAGSTARLHVRLVFLFSLIAAIPTLLFATFSALLFQFGIDYWFSDDSRGLMENASQLAQDYYEQNQLDVGEETITMASDMRAYLERGDILDDGFPTYYGFQAQGRDISESVILQEMPDGTTRTAAVLNLREDNRPTAFVDAHLASLKAGQAVHVEGGPQRIEAVAPIDRESGIYLYNARNSETENFLYWRRAESIARSYDQITSGARALQVRFNLALFAASLALVALAVWFALRFADRQVQPMTELVAAARRVGQGNFSMRIAGRTSGDEIGLLNRAFNRMTAQLEQQTRAIVAANRQLAERRSFIEAVLESVSAGIVSTDDKGRVLLLNSSAQQILTGRVGPIPGGASLAELSPGLAKLVAQGSEGGVLTHNRAGEILTLAVRIGEGGGGCVVTFDDITRQLLDQRQAAWSDVARRIAHEIKNPLTPIQLAAERLKRRYRKQIVDDGELFEDLTRTIIRQVGDLRKMVDEFSSFARLPKPVFRNEDMVDLVKQAVFLQEVAAPRIAFSFISEDEPPVPAACDRHQVGQALTNVLKNAVEAVEARYARKEIDYRGAIDVRLSAAEEMVAVQIADNGIGLPKDTERMVEPYVTSREKGTGLGLAIVKKVVEEHGGQIEFRSSEGGGSTVRLTFARTPLATLEAAE